MNLKKRVKAQVTVFVIIGFVILVSFMLLSAVVNVVKKNQMRAEARTALKSYIETSTINQYVTSCVDAVMDKGLELIMVQGGNIYDYQYPPDPDLNFGVNSSGFIQGENFTELNFSALEFQGNHYNETNDSLFNVTYTLKMVRDNSSSPPYISNYKLDPPFYPMPYQNLLDINGFINDVYSVYVPSHTGFYGDNFLNALCEYFIDCGTKSSAYYFSDQLAVKEQLETYLEQNVKQCVNFSQFEEETPYNISDGNITAEVYFSPDNLYASLDYPIEILWRGAEPVTEILTFQKEKPVRLSKIYELAYSILKYESFDLFFGVNDYKNMVNDNTFVDCKLSDNSYCYDSQISVSKFSNVNGTQTSDDEEYDDLVVIVDNASLIKGKPAIFSFVIENRRPALDYINDYEGDKYNIVALENTTIDLTPQGYDPDDSEIWYDYSGWREDYIEIFDREAWWNDGANLNNYTDYIDRDNTNPENWTQSDEYVDFYPHQNASYKTEINELGPHNVTITIWDEENLKDWQLVKILVYDLPQAIANASNNYTDIGLHNASVEDPYFLDGSLSYAIVLPEGEDFIFNWYSDYDPSQSGYNFSFVTNDAFSVLPQNNFNISNITQFHFLKPLFSYPLDAQINLQVGTDYGDGFQQYGDLDSWDVEIHECLPHINSDYEDLPYPYSKGTIDNPFQASHLCCGNESDNWGNVSDSSVVCYDVVDYSSWVYYNSSTAENDYWQGFMPSGSVTGYDALPESINHNIYKRTFERSCDGSRGNICNGSGDVSFTDFKDCEEVACRGPPKNYFDGYSPSGSSCVTYSDGDTFDSILNDEDDYVPCTETNYCYAVDGRDLYSDDNAIAFDRDSADTGNFLCSQAFCDGESDYNSNTTNCGYLKKADCSCSDICNSSISSNCNNTAPGHSWNTTTPLLYSYSNGTGDNYGCGYSCQDIECSPYAFDSQNVKCYSSANTVDHCAQNATLDESEDACVYCDNHFDSDNCEENCGADSFCDEKDINYTQDLNFCNDSCEESDCVDLMDAEEYVFNKPRKVGGVINCTCIFDEHCASGYDCNVASGICEMESANN